MWPAGKGNEAPWDWLQGWRAVYPPWASEPRISSKIVQMRVEQFERLAGLAEALRGARRPGLGGLHFPLDTSDSDAVGSPAT